MIKYHKEVAMIIVVVLALFVGYGIRDLKANWDNTIANANASFEVTPAEFSQEFTGKEPGFYNYKGEPVSSYTHDQKSIGMVGVRTIFYFIPPKTGTTLNLVPVASVPVGYIISPQAVGILENSLQVYLIEVSMETPNPMAIKITAEGRQSLYEVGIFVKNSDFYGYQ